jgi:hypothetical protein
MKLEIQYVVSNVTVLVNCECERLGNEMVSVSVWAYPTTCVRLLRNTTKLSACGEQFLQPIFETHVIPNSEHGS